MKYKWKKLASVLLAGVMLTGMMPTSVMAEDGCAHTNAVFYDFEGTASSCFEPGVGGYWFCEDCSQYLDESKENGYWEELLASKIPATGHAFNADTGSCDNCGLANSIYSKVTSIADVNEEDMYIFVVEVGGRYFVLGGLDESTADEQGNVWGHEDGNAIEVIPNADGSISLLNQNFESNMIPSEFMLDVNPDQWNFSEMGLTTVMPLLPNYCVFSFQSYDLHNTGYLGVSRYADGMYGRWDGGAWAIDFYTTEVDENTYRDDMDGYTHAEQVARGNIGDNIAEGDLLMYPASFYSVGGAMFTLRFREYVNEDDVTEYYFICGEDGYLVGSEEWDSVTDTTPTNDTQYAISLYRYDVPAVDTHTCEWSDWTPVAGTNNHTRTCQDTTCGKTETVAHGWDNGTETKAPECTETGTTTYSCADCGATKTEDIDALDHDWSDWVDDGANVATDTHSHTCNRNCGVTAESEPHNWGDWTPDGDAKHKKTCSGCGGTRTDTHNWDDGVVTDEPSEEKEGETTYTCTDCGHTKTEPIDKLDHVHSWGDWEQKDETTHIRSCTKQSCGYEETEDHSWQIGIGENEGEHVCGICGTAIEHNYQNEVVQAPTCDDDGQTKYTCPVCNDEYFVDAPAAEGHTMSSKWQYSANMPSEHFKVCTVCGGEYEGEEHDYAWTEYPEKGVEIGICDGCGHEEVRYVQFNVTDSVDDETNNIVIDASETESVDFITTVTIPAAAMEEIADYVADSDNSTDGLTVELPGEITVTYNAAAVAAINDNLPDNSTLSCVIKETNTMNEPTKESSDEGVQGMTQQQKDTIDSMSDDAECVVVYEITLTVTDSAGSETTTTEISDFGDDGSAEITVPYTLPDGMTADQIVVYRVETTGERIRIECTYDAEKEALTWITPSHSYYMIATVNTVYKVEFDSVGGTAIKTQNVPEGDKAIEPVDPVKDGYEFMGWTLNGTAYNFSEPVTENITLTATWEEKNSTDSDDWYDDWYRTMLMLHSQKFDITASAADGGEITPAGVTKVQYSRNITYTITPVAGYEIKAVYVDGVNVGSVSEYTFKRVMKDHTIYAEFALVYKDVNASDWFYDDVVYVAENGLMNGTGDNLFSPDVNTTRAMIVTILWRLEGEASAASAGFTDVAADMWYTEAIDWAAANGIVLGYGDGTFGPEKNITREQVMAILHRYAAYKGWDDGIAVSMIAQYSCSVWAENNVNWADMNGLLVSLGVDVSDMTAEVDRAELAAYLRRFCKNIVDFDDLKKR